jgi:serine/threonine protein kinase
MTLLLVNVQNSPASPMARYTLAEPIGEGGNGAVYRAWDQELRRHVAIKRIKASSVIEAEVRKEVECLSALQHPNIVSIFEVGVDAEGVFVVMELVRGETLEDIACGKQMPMSFFYQLADQLCRGLAAAHACGLVHQDFKPGNVMLHFHNDKTFTAKILDFGLPKTEQDAATPADASEDGGDVIVGSIYTIAPEQLRREPVDQRTDIYALGCVFYFTLLGRYPYQAATTGEIIQSHLDGRPVPVRALRREVPQAISDLVSRMLTQDPAERPPTVQKVRALIQSAKKRKKPAVPVVGVGEPIARTARGQRNAPKGSKA